MSRKHFAMFAERMREHIRCGEQTEEALRQRKQEVYFAATSFAAVASSVSASFNRTKFYLACGIEV